ncbi:hypothetical protein MESS4_p20090 [Mesorhizobium sp. STM 4661]|nr:hypothetical protein MESS4_p20090 [Mesorhizobium sp. STM 4661]
MSAMLTHIVECPNALILPFNDDHILIVDQFGYILARIPYPAFVADIDPTLVENRSLFLFENG